MNDLHHNLTTTVWYIHMEHINNSFDLCFNGVTTWFCEKWSPVLPGWV